MGEESSTYGGKCKHTQNFGWDAWRIDSNWKVQVYVGNNIKISKPFIYQLKHNTVALKEY